MPVHWLGLVPCVHFSVDRLGGRKDIRTTHCTNPRDSLQGQVEQQVEPADSGSHEEKRPLH